MESNQKNADATTAKTGEAIGKKGGNTDSAVTKSTSEVGGDGNDSGGGSKTGYTQYASGEDDDSEDDDGITPVEVVASLKIAIKMHAGC